MTNPLTSQSLCDSLTKSLSQSVIKCLTPCQSGSALQHLFWQCSLRGRCGLWSPSRPGSTGRGPTRWTWAAVVPRSTARQAQSDNTGNIHLYLSGEILNSCTATTTCLTHSVLPNTAGNSCKHEPCCSEWGHVQLHSGRKTTVSQCRVFILSFVDWLRLHEELSRIKAIIQTSRPIRLLTLSPFTCSWEIPITDGRDSPFFHTRGRFESLLPVSFRVTQSAHNDTQLESSIMSVLLSVSDSFFLVFTGSGNRS